jgi:hypothetical protein
MASHIVENNMDGKIDNGPAHNVKTEQRTIGQKYIEKYPDRIPVVVTAKNITISKTKFLVPNDCTMGYLIVVLRKYTGLGPEESMITFVGNLIPRVTETLGDIYSKHADPKDYCLHVVVTKENVFG